MDTFQSIITTCVRHFVKVGVICLIAMSSATGNDSGSICSIETISASFKQILPPPPPRNATAVDTAVDTVKIPPEIDIKDIQQNLIFSKFITGSDEKKFVDGKLGHNTKLALQYLCLYFRVEEPVETLAPRLLELLEKSAGKSKNYPALKPQEKEADDILPRYHQIQVNGGDCGCSEDYSALVYGFYPYWSAEGKEQVIDFSLFDRIGFYALRVSHDGKIADPLQWSNDWYIADFINQAHRYKVELDAIYYMTNWQNWSDEQIHNASYEIVKSASKRFKSRSPEGWLSRIDQWVRDSSSARADGINLYFDQYTETDQSKKLKQISLAITDLLQSKKSNLKVSITLGLPFKAKDESQKTLLKESGDILLDKNPQSDEALIENIFVFLPDKSSDTKKHLRSSIENAFKGLERKRILRKVVPVIATSGVKEDKADWKDALNNFSKQLKSQFVDDLIYMENNFAGVGLWPLPLAADSEKDEIKLKLERLFSADVTSNQFLGNIIDDHFPQLCQFVCPNRWYFRLLLDLLVGVIVAYWIISRFHCRLRDFYHDHSRDFLILFTITILVIITTLTCDPSWKQRANNVVSIFIAAIVAISLLSYIRKKNQPPLP